MISTERRFLQFPHYEHQLEEYENHRDDIIRALFWEQGLGKSKAAIDKACYLYTAGKINGFLVVAPPGIERNWVSKELPAHLWDRDNTLVTLYRSSSASAKYHQKELERSVNFNGFSVACISYDAMKTDKGRDFARAFLGTRTVFQVLDESTRIKSSNRKCKTTRIALACTKHTAYRMIMTGTPVSNGPFDIFFPFVYLDPKFWKDREFSPFSTFKSYFGLFVSQELQNGRTFQRLVQYRQLATLRHIISDVASRKTKAECLDLPEKIYSRSYFPINAKQKQAYIDMESLYACNNDGTAFDIESILTTPEDELDITTGQLAIVRLLRFQQIICGYVPRDDGEPVAVLGKTNPRLDALEEVVADHTFDGNKTIIWSRFRIDLANIAERMRGLGYNVVEYHGGIDKDTREANITAFQDGDAEIMVANKAMSQGFTLTACKTMIFNANTFSLEDRQQEEDRAHRIGQDGNLKIIDMCAQFDDCTSTVDDQIIDALQNKLRTANEITGDGESNWT